MTEKERAPRRPCRFLQFTSHCPYISPMFLDFIYILTHCGAWLIVRLRGFCSHIVDHHCYCFLCYLALAEPLAFLECILLVLHHSLSLPTVTASFCLINKIQLKFIFISSIFYTRSQLMHIFGPPMCCIIIVLLHFLKMQRHSVDLLDWDLSSHLFQFLDYTWDNDNWGRSRYAS